MTSLQAFVEACTNLPFDQLQSLSHEQLDNLRDALLRQRRFDNAAKDFVTVVLNTKEIAPDEDSLRLELVRIVHLCEGATLHLAVNGSDEEFRRRCEQRIQPVAFQVLQLLRLTASACSVTEEARSEWLSFPSAYKDDFAIAFRRIIETARTTLAETHTAIAPVPGASFVPQPTGDSESESLKLSETRMITRSDNDQNPKATSWLYLLIACIVIAIPFLIYRFLVLDRLSQILSE